MKKNIILVIGAGSWGTALSIQLTRSSKNLIYINSWCDAHNSQMISSRKNLSYGYSEIFPKNLKAIKKYEDIIESCTEIVIAVPSFGFFSVLKKLKLFIAKEQGIILTSKGFCKETEGSLYEVTKEFFPYNDICCLSGPSFSEEIIRGLPTRVVVSSEDSLFSNRVSSLFQSESFFCQQSEDIIGLQIGGAVKNIISIGCGISDGLGYGNNTKSIVITQGFKELIYFGKRIGGKTKTFYGLSGLGDLILTSMSKQSRNYKFGFLLGKGESIKSANEYIKQTIEGMHAAFIVNSICKKYKLKLPLIEEVYSILYERKKIENFKLLIKSL